MTKKHMLDNIEFLMLSKLQRQPMTEAVLLASFPCRKSSLLREALTRLKADKFINDVNRPGGGRNLRISVSGKKACEQHLSRIFELHKAKLLQHIVSSDQQEEEAKGHMGFSTASLAQLDKSFSEKAIVAMLYQLANDGLLSVKQKEDGQMWYCRDHEGGSAKLE
jgi:DNA-binding PadR family transcriptional regulator